MSSMAKIFVVVNLILGVVAFGSAATLLGTKEDYKAANAEMAKNFDRYKSEQDAKLSAAEKEKAAQVNAASAAVTAKETAEASNGDLTKRLAAAETASGSDRATIQQLANQVKTQVELNKTYSDLVDKLTGTSKSAVADKLNFQTKWQNEVTNRVNLEGEVRKAQAENAELAAKNGDLEKQLKTANFWVNKYRERFGDITGGPNGADGVVKSVKGNLVVLSVGSGDGVRNGDTYQLRRGSSYVGQVTITAVYKDQSVGTFDSTYKGPGAPPQAGDAASAKNY
jgi:hypothetical protein